MDKDKLNGSVQKLAEALGGVIIESMSVVKEEMKGDITAMEERLMQRMDNRFDGFEKSIQGQFDHFKNEIRGSK